MVLSTLPGPFELAVDRDEAPRINAYREMRDFYAGGQWLGKARRGQNRQTYNYARRLVRSAVSYMFPSPVTFNVPPSEESEEGSKSAALAEWTLSDYLGHIGADELDNQLAEDAAVAGDAVAKVTWDPELGMPIVTAVDAAQVRVETRPDQPKVALAWEHHYAMTAAELAAAMPEAAARIAALPAVGDLEQGPRRRVIERWTDAELVVTFGGTLGDPGSEVFRGVNPYGWMPYVAIANNPTAHSFWGSSDLADLLDVCRMLNTRMSVLADILDLSGYPIAVLEGVDGSENIKVGPGAKWELPEDAKAYLLDLLGSAGVTMHTECLDQVLRAMHDLSETPRTAFGDTGRTISGAALEVEIQPLVQKVRRKRRGFDTYYRGRNWRLLDLAERFGGVPLNGVRRAVAVWPDILPSDADGEANRLSVLTGADNLSHRTAMAEWGVEDPEAEWKKLLEERAAVTAFEVQVAEARSEPFGGEGGEDAGAGAGGGA